jgi:two-component system, sensor histidine kinase and response regulator
MKKVLVIEDEPQVRANIEEILNLLGFQATTACDGMMGLQLVHQEMPDLIMCDIMMPGLDGYGVLTSLRQDEVTANIPFIFLTAKVNRPDLRQGMELGADDYLTKPFTPNELLKSIAVQLEKREVSKRHTQTQLNQLRHNISFALPHELRTPLNGILGFSELLIQDYDILPSVEVLEIAQAMRESALRLYRLTQNFLLYADLELLSTDLARLHALLNTPAESYSRPTVTDVVRQKFKVADREGDLLLQVEDFPLPISELKLRKIVDELVDNALKFSKSNTPIHIVGRIEEDTFVLHVTDHGRGMTSEQISQMGAYMQFDRKLHEQQGSGLGLTIARRLIELHGGSLSVESIPDQQTTVKAKFNLTLYNKVGVPRPNLEDFSCPIDASHLEDTKVWN